MRPDSPMISIITPCLNRAHMIEECIHSVCAQNYSNFEHIIIDGGSTDGTLELLKKHKHLVVISEPDKNLYDGLNKGILQAKGDIVGHLNSDDYYEPNIFKKIVETFQGNPESDSVCGGALVFEITENNQKIIRQCFTEDKFKYLNLNVITYGMPIINARFFRKEVYEKIGLYNIAFPIAADREFLIRTYLGSIKTLSVDQIFYHYRFHDGSLTINDHKKTCIEVNPEYLSIIKKYLATPNLSPEIYTACRNWHTWMLGYCLWQLLRNNCFGQAMNMMREGYKWDKLFLLRYLNQRLRFMILKC